MNKRFLFENEKTLEAARVAKLRRKGFEPVDERNLIIAALDGDRLVYVNEAGELVPVEDHPSLN